jgi:hypothetical protein
MKRAHCKIRPVGLLGLALTLLLSASVVPAIAQTGFKMTRDLFGYQFCAGYFWSMEQCVIPQFREAYRSAFMSMAREAATLDHRPIPLTEEEATEYLAASLRATWNPGRCENARSSMNSFGDVCTELLRAPSGH